MKEIMFVTDVLNDEKDFEELYGKWEPKLYAAAMADNDRYFALLIGGPRWDDPYTIILTRDAVSQTFSRFDVRRELRDIRVIPSLSLDEEPSYVAISLNGDIYVVRSDGPEHSVIPSTRAEIDNAPDIEFSSIIPLEDRWLVAGSDGFLKIGKDNSWEDAAPFLENSYPYKKPKWSILGTDQAGNFFVVATELPDTRFFKLYPGHPLYREGMPDEERFALKKKLHADRNAYPQITTLFYGRPGVWKQQKLPQRIAQSLPSYPYVSGLASAKDGKTFIFGSDGAIMEGINSNGLSEIGALPDREKHFSHGALWQDGLLLAAGSELFKFDDHLAQPFLPKVRIKLGAKRMQPSAMFVRDGNLYVFDYGLRYFIFDGNEWNQRDIPDDLSERPFKGSPQK